MTSINDKILERRGLILIVSAPPGAGKTTLTRALLKDDPNLTLSISTTTRPQRPGETNNVHYHFVNNTTFNSMIQNNHLLEYATVFGERYGTPQYPVEQALNNGYDILFDIDWQGKRQLKKKLPQQTISVFILSTSLQSLEQRMKYRARDTPQEIKQRMKLAKNEIKHCKEYDYIIINQNLQHSISQLKAILTAERLKRKRQTNLNHFINNILHENKISS